MIDFGTINPAIMAGLQRYVGQHIRPGDFLCCVISNDLVGAFSSADEHSIATMHSIVGWLYSEAPAMCWGSRDRLNAWLSRVEA